MVVDKPRVAFLLQMFGIGGMPKWLFNLASVLIDEFEFHFIATHSDYIIPDYRKVAHVAVLPFRKWPLAAYLFRNRIDIAQVANLRLYIDAARLARVPSVIERVDGVRNGAALNPKEGLDLVIASTRGVVPYIEKLIDPKRIRVIYNGVDLAAFELLKAERFGFGDEDIIVGRTSRLAGGKNISLLIAAIIELRKQERYKRVRLVICGGDTTQVGAPGMLAKLREEAAPLGDNVVFTGEVLDTGPITKGFDIATCTSRPGNEGIPNSLIEGMAAGKPVVATNTDDIPELVEQNETGLLFESDDLDGLVSELRRLIDNPKLREKMGNAGRKRVEERFDLAAQSEMYRKCYHQLIANKGTHFLNQVLS